MIDIKNKLIIRAVIYCFHKAKLVLLGSTKKQLDYLQAMGSFHEENLKAPSSPYSFSQVCDRVGHQDLTGVTGLLLIVYGVGSTLGPIMTPWFIMDLGDSGLMVYYITMSMLLTILGSITILGRKGGSREDHHEYEPLMHLNPVIYELEVGSDQGKSS